VPTRQTLKHTPFITRLTIGPRHLFFYKKNWLPDWLFTFNFNSATIHLKSIILHSNFPILLCSISSTKTQSLLPLPSTIFLLEVLRFKDYHPYIEINFKPSSSFHSSTTQDNQIPPWTVNFHSIFTFQCQLVPQIFYGC